MSKISFIALSSFLAAMAAAYTEPKTGPEGNPVTNPSAPMEIQGGQPFDFTWTPTTAGTVSIVLYKGDATNLQPVGAIVEKIQNSGKYTWNVPADLEASSDNKGYGLQIIADNDGQYQWSAAFGIEQQGGGGGGSGGYGPPPPSYSTDEPTYPTEAPTETPCTEGGKRTVTVTVTQTLEACTADILTSVTEGPYPTDSILTGAEYSTGGYPAESILTGAEYSTGGYPAESILTGAEYSTGGAPPCPSETILTGAEYSTPCPSDSILTGVTEGPYPTGSQTGYAPIITGAVCSGDYCQTMETATIPTASGCIDGYGGDCSQNSTTGSGPIPSYVAGASSVRPMAWALSVIAAVGVVVAL